MSNISEVLSIPEDAPRLDQLKADVAAINDNSPGLENLWPHQLSVVGSVFDYIEAMTPEEIESPEGACLLLPQGSGKTLLAVSVIRALSAARGRPVKALFLSPTKQIRNGTAEKLEKFAPELDGFKYKSSRTRYPGTICNMLYQGIQGAIDQKFIDRFDPDIIFPDEAHHVIDGHWAKNIDTNS